MALAREAQQKSNLADRQVCLAEQRAGLLDAPCNHVGIRRDARRRTELAREGIDGECEESGEISKRDVRSEMDLDILLHTSERSQAESCIDSLQSHGYSRLRLP